MVNTRITAISPNMPDVNVDFHSGVTFDPQPALLQRELDVVLTSDILDNQRLHYTALFDYEVKLVLSPDHPLANRLHIQPQDLISETLFIYPRPKRAF